MFFHKENAFDYAFKGEKLLLEKNYEKAIVYYNQAIQLAEEDNFPNIDLYYSSRATIYKHLQNLNEALSDINKAIEVQPKIYLYYFERSEIKELLGDKKGAQQDLNTIYKILDQNNSTHIFKIYLAKKKMEQEKYKEAEAIINTFDEDCYNNEPVLLMKEKLYEKTCNYEKQIKELDKLIEMYPLRVMFLEKKIAIYIKRNKNNKALEILKKALTIEPGNSHLHILGGQIFYYMKENEKAIEAFKKALTLSPSEMDKKKCTKFLKVLEENA